MQVKNLTWEDYRSYCVENKSLGAFISGPNFKLWKESSGKKVLTKEDDAMARESSSKRKRDGDGRPGHSRGRGRQGGFSGRGR